MGNLLRSCLLFALSLPVAACGGWMPEAHITPVPCPASPPTTTCPDWESPSLESVVELQRGYLRLRALAADCHDGIALWQSAWESCSADMEVP